MESIIYDVPAKILLVSSKKENRPSFQTILSGKEYDFVEAKSGKEAIRILLKTPDFEIILIDLEMSVTDGFETAKLIHQHEKLKRIPLIFLNEISDTDQNKLKAYQLGALDYITKPIAPEILRAKISVFADLHKKNRELQIKQEEINAGLPRLLKDHERLVAQCKVLEKRVVELEDKNKELDAFTYISSHDLQEPLRKIQTFINILLTDEFSNLSEKGKIRFERILYSTNRMHNLIQSLLLFSRTSIVDRKFEMLNLDAIITEVREELNENLLEKKGIITTDFHAPIKIIPFQFRQLMINLINNSLKFSKPNVPMLIEMKSQVANGASLENEKLIPEQNYTHITYQDNGIGFDSQYNEKIFGVFQKLHSKDAYEGTGIGLAIVKKIIENHNGYIAANGKPGTGARFDIYIPN